MFPGRQDALTGGHDLVEEDGQLARRVDLDPLPAPDLRDGRARLRLLEVGRDRLEPAGDRVEPLGQRGVIAREEQEQAVADMVERERAPLPDPQLRVVEDGAADVVDLEVPLEGGLARQPGRVDRLDLGQVLALVGELAEQGVATAVAEEVVVVVEADGVANTGLSRTSRTNRVSTRS